MPTKSNTVQIVVALWVFLVCSFAFADEVKVSIKVHVKLDRLHPDVDRAVLYCNYYDINGKGSPLKSSNRCSDNFIADVDKDNRSLNTTLEDCFMFDEAKAMAFAWDRYKCEVYVDNDKEGTREKLYPTNPKAWARIQPESKYVSEGKFDMYAK